MTEAPDIGFAVAFFAGLLSFLSPCVLPLIPSYASFITGMGLDELTDAAGRSAHDRGRMFLHGALFVLGFSAVFIALGASATSLGAAFQRSSPWLERAGGALLVLFGLMLAGVVRIPGLSRDWRVHLSDRPAGYAGTVFVGVAFGAGWTPCIGPQLGGILTLAATTSSVGQGTALLATYSAGLAIPFLLATVALDRFLAVFGRLRGWLPWVNRAAGAMLILVGLLLITGKFTVLSAIFAEWTPDFLLDRL